MIDEEENDDRRSAYNMIDGEKISMMIDAVEKDDDEVRIRLMIGYLVKYLWRKAKSIHNSWSWREWW